MMQQDWQHIQIANSLPHNSHRQIVIPISKSIRRPVKFAVANVVALISYQLIA